MQHFSIRISNSEQSVFRCGADDTILSGSLRSGTGFPYECNSGGCGSCQFELSEGELKNLWPDAPGLAPRAKERGRRLACQSVPLSDCTIRVFGRAMSPAIAPQRRTLTFTTAHPLTPDMAEFSFRSATAATFLPGQFAMFRFLKEGGLRAYSMSNLPNPSGEWNFIIRRIPGGKATANLFDSLKPGDEVRIDAPYGNAYLRTQNRRDIVCIAGGSGLSPVLSILRGAVRTPELSDRRIYLFYGGRGPQDICLPEILADDPILKQRVILYTAISDDNAPNADQWMGGRGFIHELVGTILGAEIPTFDYYFCGPTAMTDAVHRMLLIDHKVPADQLYFDRFF